MPFTSSCVPIDDANYFDISATLANDAFLYQIAPHTSSSMVCPMKL
ncbi:hypothetical protein BGT96224_Ac31378 [Blumeria graminis f. sp. tritici 96224]|uniref:Uncharacterized protein n=1 Tax=Blumeria graminis f. sp. tritici 96224 TaxID=1268274 RepID=A0A656KMU3_BLUGR|nr:hypothetical protein BGT96224_Ac31378 [Blumeria graminis f. sp. tritici 96224]